MSALIKTFDIDATDFSEVEHVMFGEIPMARAMQLRVRSFSDDNLVLAAPLAPNINDKGCAFGGSLVSALTLSGWGLIFLRLRALGIHCDIYVQDSQIRYLLPVWSDFDARAQLAEGESWDSFMAMLKTRGRARLCADCAVTLDDGKPACTLQARFVVIARR
ncbi:MAG: YiiD C-terminal domain-containing protein [Rudaea sp.]